MRREATRLVHVGPIPVGAGSPVSVQTMLNDDPHDVDRLVAHCESCRDAGADIVRITIPDIAAAKALGEIKRRTNVPIVSDIHFDYRCALAAIEAGTDALRLNPGNIGARDRVQAVARAAKAKQIPILIGVNLGSLEKGLRDNSAISVPEKLCASALGHLKLLEDEGFRDCVISAKASNVADTLMTYRLLAERTDCPLHIGVTEAGTFIPGTVRSSVAMGILLSEGIGDTIRVSLTDKPEREVKVGLEILRSLGLRTPGPAITSCPTCGRTRVELIKVATEVEEKLEQLSARYLGSGKRLPKVAVMGCAVNGPGEAKGADIALCGGIDEFLLFVHGECVRKLPESAAVDAVVEAYERMLA